MRQTAASALGKSEKERAASRTTIAALYLSGISSSDLGKRYGLRSYYITQYILKPAGITPRIGRPKDRYINDV